MTSDVDLEVAQARVLPSPVRRPAARRRGWGGLVLALVLVTLAAWTVVLSQDGSPVPGAAAVAERTVGFVSDLLGVGRDVARLAPLGLNYLHWVEGPSAVTAQIRQVWPGTLIVNAAFTLPTTPENLTGLLEDRPADLVAVGRAFIANPDLAQGLQLDAPLNPADETNFYGDTDAGYIDYPALDRAA